MALFVGTSGWAYPEWRGSFYPARLPQAEFLGHYGQTLSACEVNATFYRIQSETAVARWAEAVPDSFRFTVKAHRRLSYRKQLTPDAGSKTQIDEFVASLAPLGEKLGCLLIQVPEFLERDDAGLERLLDLLPSEMPFACELQHPSWEVPEITARVAERGGTVCLREESGEAPGELPAGPLGYVRLKGLHYGDSDRRALLELLVDEGRRRDVYAFARHKDVDPGDAHTGVGLAEWLVEATRAGAGPNR